MADRVLPLAPHLGTAPLHVTIVFIVDDTIVTLLLLLLMKRIPSLDSQSHWDFLFVMRDVNCNWTDEEE